MVDKPKRRVLRLRTLKGEWTAQRLLSAPEAGVRRRGFRPPAKGTPALMVLVTALLFLSLAMPARAEVYAGNIGSSNSYQAVPVLPNNSNTGWTTLRLGSRGPDVYQLETWLNALGYNVGLVGDNYSSLTKQAVEQFQRDHGLPVTGQADAATASAIENAYQQSRVPANTPASGNGSGSPGDNAGSPTPSPPPQPPAPPAPPPAEVNPSPPTTPGTSPAPGPALYRLGSKGTGVLEIERLLNSLGYNVGMVGDQYSSLTRDAVKAFQTDQGLPVTGEIDARTLETLRRAASSPATGTPPAGSPGTQPPPNPPTSPPATDPAGQGQNLTAEESRMVSLVNQERAKAGVPPLVPDPQLTTLARMKSLDMIDNHYFGHISPVYGSPFDMLDRAGIRYRTAGENIAGARTVEQAHTNLMNSPGHRANILDPSYQLVGIGIVDGGPYGKMFTQLFVGR